MSPSPQPGIFAVGARAHHHLQYDVVADVDLGALLGALRAIRGAATTVRGVNVVVGLGRDLCARIAPEWLPEGVVPFPEMRGTDGGPWNRICALPALWVGLLYDDTAIDAAWDLVRHWSMDEREALRLGQAVHQRAPATQRDRVDGEPVLVDQVVAHEEAMHRL